MNSVYFNVVDCIDGLVFIDLCVLLILIMLFLLNYMNLADDIDSDEDCDATGIF